MPGPRAACSHLHLRHLFHFHQAHAAGGLQRVAFVIAERRNLDARAFGRFDHERARRGTSSSCPSIVNFTRSAIMQPPASASHKDKASHPDEHEVRNPDCTKVQVISLLHVTKPACKVSNLSKSRGHVAIKSVSCNVVNTLSDAYWSPGAKFLPPELDRQSIRHDRRAAASRVIPDETSRANRRAVCGSLWRAANGAANLATSTCTRRLNNGGGLIKIVDLDGAPIPGSAERNWRSSSRAFQLKLLVMRGRR